jgi:hypothetical protein
MAKKISRILIEVLILFSFLWSFMLFLHEITMINEGSLAMFVANYFALPAGLALSAIKRLIDEITNQKSIAAFQFVSFIALLFLGYFGADSSIVLLVIAVIICAVNIAWILYQAYLMVKEKLRKS